MCAVMWCQPSAASMKACAHSLEDKMAASKPPAPKTAYMCTHSSLATCIAAARGLMALGHLLCCLVQWSINCAKTAAKAVETWAAAIASPARTPFKASALKPVAYLWEAFRICRTSAGKSAQEAVAETAFRIWSSSWVAVSARRVGSIDRVAGNASPSTANFSAKVITVSMVEAPCPARAVLATFEAGTIEGEAALLAIAGCTPDAESGCLHGTAPKPTA
mmetsp:Transcript_48436/g.115158  ORF Transcript_48436/g.115158 Transcript_48436/m.115158 type:complete len:220 (-) Transcript_48436:806-1465(-)